MSDLPQLPLDDDALDDTPPVEAQLPALWERQAHENEPAKAYSVFPFTGTWGPGAACPPPARRLQALLRRGRSGETSAGGALVGLLEVARTRGGLGRGA